MKKLIVLALLVASALAQTPTCDSPELKGAVDGINQSVPMQVDEDTFLVGARCKDGELIYKYRLAENSQINTFNELKLNITKNIIQNTLKQSYCGQDPNFKLLRQLTKAIVWSYDYTDGTNFIDVRYSPSDCEFDRQNGGQSLKFI